MNYISTRNTADSITVSSAIAIKNGLAPDGGLYVPEYIPTLTVNEIEALTQKAYPERAAYVLSKFLEDFTTDELLEDCSAAYSDDRFPGGPAPIVKLNNTISVLELWHGPTCAFKDMALQIMPRLLCRSLKKTGEDRTALILVATSGDTGKAALEGYRDISGIKIKVFYPALGVSKVQKLQMATQTGSNVDVCAIHGNFDDAQSGVKRIFADSEIAAQLDKKGVFLSSANSINWGRLAPQIVYYVSAYCDMINNGEIAIGDKVNVCVPTGNFGNIFAAYIAKKMGLPINKLICASNQNNILTDFLTTGTYDRNREFYTTMSPSMDILISSNLERLLFTVCGPEKTVKYMNELSKLGKYTVDAVDLKKIKSEFEGFYCDENLTYETIHDTFENDSYLCDTHTAVGLACAKKYVAESNDTKKIILASTASPYKFASDVYCALTNEKPENELTALEALSMHTKTFIPAPLSGLDKRDVRFTKVIHAEEMPDNVLGFVE